MRKKIITIITIIGLIVLSNIYSGIIDLFVRKDVYTYETYDGKYKININFVKGGKVSTLLLKFRHLQILRPEYKGTKIYRTFQKNPLLFWDWYNYFTLDRYKFPYKKSSNKSVISKLGMGHVIPNFRDRKPICLFFYSNCRDIYKLKTKEGKTKVVKKYRKEVTQSDNKTSTLFYINNECFIVENKSKVATCNIECLENKKAKFKTLQEMQEEREITKYNLEYKNNLYSQIYLAELNNGKITIYPVKWKY